MVVLYIYRFFSCLLMWRGVKLYPFWLKLHVLACWAELSWGLNVDHWVVAVIVWLSTVLSLCSGSTHTASCTTHVFDQGFFFFFPSSSSFFDPLCTSIYSLKGNKGCVMSLLFKFKWKMPQRSVFLHWDVWFVSLMLVLFMNYLGLMFFFFFLSAFGLLQSAFQILIVHSSGLKKVLFSKGWELYRVTCIDTFV